MDPDRENGWRHLVQTERAKTRGILLEIERYGAMVHEALQHNKPKIAAERIEHILNLSATFRVNIKE